ncbi:hypothetical protein BGW80DRAFT_1325865 [Lactifluus volemus]|nr:hypothetical protein BGW80DRAFT_1325865 [Lactifluus volemus]
MKTNKDKETVCILLPSIGLFLVLFLGPLYVHVEQWTRPIGKVGLILWWLTLC